MEQYSSRSNHEIDYKIVGEEMQYVEIELDPSETAIAEAGSFMMMDDGVQMETIFGDGSQTRSFCYVDDLVEGIYRLLLSDYHLPVNIGNPSEITVMQFAHEILELVQNPKAYIDYRPLTLDDPKQLRPDITKAQHLLGWNPKFNREEGLKLTYEYFKKAVKLD